MRKSGAQIIWECLERNRVEHVFGYPGGAVLPLYDALSQSRVHHILVRHEQGGVHMADGYARASGRVGVAIGTSGPGATNMVTGIATAMMDSSPVVCITGQVNSAVIGSDAFQEVDTTGITLPITKRNYLVTKASDIAPTLQEAISISCSGRPGPTLVDITKDAQQATCELQWELATVPMSRQGAEPDPGECERALELLHGAKRPVILAGHGVLISGAMNELAELAERTQCPVALTLLGLGVLPASHPLNLGMMGMHGEVWANQAIQEADLLVALGMRFDDRVTGELTKYAVHARKIHIDIDPAEINKNVRVDCGIVGDLRSVLAMLLPEIRPVSHENWLTHIRSLRQEAALLDILNLEDDGRLYTAHVLHDLWRDTRNTDTIIVTDVGQHQMWEAQYYKHEEPRSLITSGGLGTMGFALPAAIGAKISRPDANVWVVAGDGGFQMTIPELATLVQEQVKINIAIINNGCLGMVRQWQQFFYRGNYQSTPLLSPEFSKVAEAYGIRSTIVTARSQVGEAIALAKTCPGPMLIDFRVEREDVVYPMVPSGAALDEMIRRPVTPSHKICVCVAG